MADFTPNIADDVLATIRNAHEDVAEALGRALDGEFDATVGDAARLDLNTLPESWNGPGLAVAFTVAASGGLLLLPEASGLLPDWCDAPDAVDAGKLATLAQELGIVLLPEAFAASESQAAYVGNLAGRFHSGDPAASIVVIPITLTRGEQSGIAHFVWPLQNPLAFAGEAEPSADNEVPAAPQPAANNATSQPARKIQYADLDDGIRQLPSYAKSLLKVEVPVTVTLSMTKQSVEQILQLGPGSILQFDKRCEENLELEIGGQTVAEGEAVKVGDKFGLWITSMTVPGERFWVINGKRAGSRAQ